MILTLDNVTLNSLEKNLFSNLSLTLLPGSIILLKGFNGAGKSTLLRIIAGIGQATSGKIFINDIDASTLPKPYVNYIGHNLAIKHELTVLENVYHAANQFNSIERVSAAISYFGLSEYIYEKCYKLSAGNQKKVALSRLIACNAKIWLLDEPETNLDKENKQLLSHCIYSQAANGGIIIIATHSNEEGWIKGQMIQLEDFKAI